MHTFRSALAVAVVGIALSSLQARADIELKVSDGTTTVSANDLLTPGTVTYMGAIGKFTFTANIGAGFPGIGAPTYPILDLTSVDLTTRTTGGTLTVSLTETGFAPTTVAMELLSRIVGNYNNSNATMDTYFDATDNPFGTGTLLSSGLFDNQAGVATLPPMAGPYSLTEIITVDAGANSLTSLDAIIDAPEPTALSLFGAGFVGLAFFGWRRWLRAARRIPAATA